MPNNLPKSFKFRPIYSRPASDEYRDNYDGIFRKKPTPPKDPSEADTQKMPRQKPAKPQHPEVKP
jgi:hypothetical protein